MATYLIQEYQEYNVVPETCQPMEDGHFDAEPVITLEKGTYVDQSIHSDLRKQIIHNCRK